MSTGQRMTRRGVLQPAVTDGAPAARILLEPVQQVCSGCAVPCGNAPVDQLLLSGPALRAAGMVLPAAARPVRVSVERRGLEGAAAVIFGVPLVLLLIGAVLGERLAEQGGSILLGYTGVLASLALLPWLSPRLLSRLALRVDSEHPQDRFSLPEPSSDQLSEHTVI